MQFSDMKVGSVARIIKVHPGEKAYRKRLLAMGLVPGAQVILSRIAPLGDPIEIVVRGFALCLRQDEARLLQLEEVNSL